MFVYHRSALASAHQGQPLPKTLSVMESTPQVRGMHTIIRSELQGGFTSNCSRVLEMHPDFSSSVWVTLFLLSVCVCVGTRRLTETSLSSTPKD